MNSWVQIETGTEKKNNNNNNNNLLISTENKNVYRKFLKNVTCSTRQASAKKWINYCIKLSSEQRMLFVSS